MTITQEQYNTVINGLRVQLELQRAFHQEKLEQLKVLRELRERDAEDIKTLKVLNEDLSKSKDYYSNAYNKLEQLVEKLPPTLRKATQGRMRMWNQEYEQYLKCNPRPQQPH